MHNKPTYEELEKRLEECSIALAKAEAQLQELRAEPGNTGNALLKRKRELVVVFLGNTPNVREIV